MSVKDGLVQRGHRWSYVIRTPDPVTGRSKPRWVGGFRTKAETKAARDQARVAARTGSYVDRSQITLAKYLPDWLEGHRLAIKTKTHADYKEIIDSYLIPLLGSRKVQQLRTTEISRAYRELHTSGGKNGGPLSARTVDGVHRVLRKALNDAIVPEQLITLNPAIRATRPRLEQTTAAITWTPEEVAVFLTAAKKHRLYCIFHFAAFTGVRRGELLGLRWADVDFDSAEVTIARSAAVIGGQRVEGTPKGGRARTIPLDAGTVKALSEHRLRQRVERLAAGPVWAGGTDCVFLTETGKPIHDGTPTSLLPKIAKTAGLPRTRFHDLRHMHATTLLGAGVPVHVVAARLGHADPAITLRVYAHVLGGQSASAAEAFAAAIPASF